MTDCFYLPASDAPDNHDFVATVLTRGPWDNRFQHGGPPCALLAGALAGWGADAEDWFLARLTVEMLRPVPIGRCRVEVSPQRLGRAVQRVEAQLSVDGEVVLLARALRIRRVTLPAEAHAPQPPARPWPAPADCPVLGLDFFRHEVAYHRGVELRVAHGAWGRTPVGFWTRPRVPLVGGRESTAVERLVTLADAQSGMGVPLDPGRWSFINPDMNVYFERDPAGDWLGFDIRSTTSAHGSGLAQSEVRDLHGVVARSIQTLVVGGRG